MIRYNKRKFCDECVDGIRGEQRKRAESEVDKRGKEEREERRKK